MRATSPIVHRIAFAGLASALAFGAASAFATTAAPRAAERACDRYTCQTGCVQEYGPGTSAYCTYRGECICLPQ
jgi:hypothetical protein